jgi:hypothetical protein
MGHSAAAKPDRAISVASKAPARGSSHSALSRMFGGLFVASECPPMLPLTLRPTGLRNSAAFGYWSITGAAASLPPALASPGCGRVNERGLI